jgi:hypothetical protein
MVIVFTGEQPHMQGKPAVDGERLQQVRDHLAAQAADVLAPERQIDAGVGTATQVDRDLGQCFVQRHGGITEPANASAFGKGFVEGLAERDADILGGVVLVDMQVTIGFDRQVETRVARKAIEHVVQETDTSGDIRPARTVQVEQYFYLALPGLTVDPRGTRLRHSSEHSNGREVLRMTALQLVRPRVRDDVAGADGRRAAQHGLSLRSAVPYLAAAALVLPLFAPEMWSGFRLALPNDVLGVIAMTEQPLSVRTPGGQWTIGLALLWFALAYWRRRASRWEAALVLLGSTASLVRMGNAWLDGLCLIAPLGAQLAHLRPRAVILGGAAVIGVLVAGASVWSTRPPELPQAAIEAAQSARGTVFADWRWAPELQRHVDGHVLGAAGLASETPPFWLDYVRITQDFEQWPAELRAMDVDLLVVDTDQPALPDQVRGSAEWRVVYEGSHALVAQRVAP